MNSFKGILENVSPRLKQVEIDRMSVVDLDTVVLPCGYIYSGDEDRVNDERALIGYETWLWNVIIEVWGKKNLNLETLLAAVHQKVYENYTLDGNAVYTTRTGSNIFYVDPAKELKGMTISFSVLYRHILGNP